MSELDKKISVAEYRRKMYSRMFMAIIVILAALTFYNNVNIGMQVYNESESTKRVRNNYLKTDAALDVYIDSVDQKSRLLEVERAIKDSAIKVTEQQATAIKALKYENKRLTDSLRAHRRLRVYNIN